MWDTNKNYCSLELVICKTASHSQAYRAQWYQGLLVNEACNQLTAQHFDEDTFKNTSASKAYPISDILLTIFERAVIYLALAFYPFEFEIIQLVFNFRPAKWN